MTSFKRLVPVAFVALTMSTAAAAEAPVRKPAASNAQASTAMVAAANPMAVDAGLRVLKAGGSAVDAAVAVQAVLGLVEPQSSGLGGGSFMTYYDAKTKKVTAYNGRETAPAGATPDMFLGPDGKAMPRPVAMTSGRSAGVPGAIAMLYLAQGQHGKLKWADLFGDAERLADQGFPAPRRMAEAAAGRSAQAATPDAIAYFTKPDGTKVQPGDPWKNPAYAATIRKIAAEGPKALLEGVTRNFGYHYAVKKKVRVNTVSQSPTRTTAGSGVKGFDAFIDYAEKMSPLGNASADDCANYCVTLFSDLSRYVTMQNLFHDGGFSFVGVSEAVVNSIKES